MNEHLQKIIESMKQDGWSEQEAILWVIKDTEGLYTEEFRDFAKSQVKS